MNDEAIRTHLNRRRFLHAAAATGVGLAYHRAALGNDSSSTGREDINVALLGGGGQGQVLMNACKRIPGIQFKAVCDIWEAYSLKRTERILKAYGHPVTAYADYEEMLENENDLDAVIVATPDFWHARHTIACLNAGLHVYCEMPMSNTISDARSMVVAARESGKLLQIGHQRRSNPRYIVCREKLVKELGLLGPLVAAGGQWNRMAYPPLGWPKRREIEDATLQRYGYESMHHFRNWRRYRGLGSGRMIDLGSQQIDVFNWFIGGKPRAVLASAAAHTSQAGSDTWYDTAAAIFDYETSEGPVTATYQTLVGNRHDGYLEKFMGNKGTLVLSERSRLGTLYPEPRVGPDDFVGWATGLKEGYLTASEPVMKLVERMSIKQLAQVLTIDDTPHPVTVDSAKKTSATLFSCDLAVEMHKPPHQPHLVNFFDATRGKAKLTCPAELGYEATVTARRINEAIEAQRKLTFKPEDFVV